MVVTSYKVMKATLEFDLNDPDERMEHLRCVKALDMASFIFELRNIRKRTESMDNNAEEVWDAIFEELDSCGVNIDELIQ